MRREREREKEGEAGRQRGEKGEGEEIRKGQKKRQYTRWVRSK